MEDLYLYLVRPDLLKDYIPKYGLQVFLNFTYPFSNMFYFLRKFFTKKIDTLFIMDRYIQDG